METQFYAIPGYPGYEVNELGVVRSVTRMIPAKAGSIKKHQGCILSQTMVKGKYPIVSLSQNNKTKPTAVSRIMKLVFFPDAPARSRLIHIDGDYKNNSLVNLKIK